MLTWYIACEFQMYLLAVIAIIVYAKRRRIGFALMIVLICQSVATGIANCLKHKLFIADGNKIWHYFYMIPYVRWYSLFVGVIWGLLYYEYSKLGKKNIFYFFEKKFVVSYFTMILGFALNVFVVLLPMWEWSEELKEIWIALRVILNVIGITLIFMPLVSHRNFYLKRFLNLRIFQMMGKTSYMTYLFADTWIYVFAYTDPAFKYEYSSLRLIWFILKVFLCSQLIAIIAHLIFEKPLINIERYYPKKKKAPTKAKKTQSSLPEKKLYSLNS